MLDRAKIKVTPGACQMKTEVIATLRDDCMVEVELCSSCEMVKRLGSSLEPMDPVVALMMPFCENPIYELSGEHIKHASCPIPLAIIKAVESVSGMAVRKDVILSYDSSEGC